MNLYDYNERGEVIEAERRWGSHPQSPGDSVAGKSYIYAYDSIGNHTTSKVNSVSTTYAANSLNQYTSILCAPAPLREPSYDLDGNMLTNGVWSYSYDAENRLTAAYSNAVCVVSNAYDHASRRVLKVSRGGAETRRFVYDCWNLVQETVADESGVTTNSFVWGKDLSGSFQGAGGIGGLLAVRQGDAWYFPLADANGNITAYVDEQGIVVASYTYDAFGGLIASSGALVETFAHRFSTKYYDTETGLYYYGYRYYSPDMMRWPSRDPMGELDAANLYLAMGNNLIDHVDYLGLWKLWTHSSLNKKAWNQVTIPQDMQKYESELRNKLKEFNHDADNDHLAEHDWHYGMGTQDDADVWKGKYSDKLAEWLAIVEQKLSSSPASESDCKEALEKLGNLTHMWQDYYAHGMNINAGYTTYTTRVLGRIVRQVRRRLPGTLSGDPENIPAHIIPCTYDHWYAPGNHGWVEPGKRAPDKDMRESNAITFTKTKLDEWIPQWWDACKCYDWSKW